MICPSDHVRPSCRWLIRRVFVSPIPRPLISSLRANQIAFRAFNGRSVGSSFVGGHITSDSGGLLLREIEQSRHFIQRISQRFTDLRDSRFVEHSVHELISQYLVKLIRHKWLWVEILVQAHSGFCREALMSWCEAKG
jgi:hypothetical protein